MMLAAFGATAVVITRLVQALRTSEARWKTAFENNPTMYFMVDSSGTVLSVNPFGAEQLGYTVAELIGQPVLNVFLDEDKPAARGHVERCLTHVGESLSWELRKVRKDGSMLWVRETARAVRLGSEHPVVLIACEDITDQKVARDKLRENEARLRGQASLLDLTHDAIFVRDANDLIVYWNRGAEEQYGWSKEEALGRVSHELTKTVFPKPLDEIVAQLLRTGRWDGELQHAKRDGTRIVVASRWSLQRDVEGNPAGVLETNNDVTAQKKAEEDRHAHLWFLESMDRINRAMQGTNDVEQMMSDVLDVTLSIFASDRVWVLYPCDPEAASWRMVVARTRPEFPFAFYQRPEGAPAFDDMRPAFRAARASAGPIRLDATSEPPLPELAMQRSGVQSALIMALHPKVGEPYLLGLSQCSYARAWTDQEERLFQEIGRRLADALTTMLVLRDLRESTRRYRNIFQMADVSIWEEDFSQVKSAIEELRSRGVSDFRRYFAEHPEFVAQAVQMVRIVDVNDATLSLAEARGKEELLESLHKVFTPDTIPVFVEELIAISEGRTSFASEATLQTLNGRKVDVLFTMAFPPEPTKLDSVLVSIMDITARKRAEEALQRAHTELSRVGALTTLGEFAGSIAHELRQPLAAITMNGSAALRWLNREHPDLDEARDAAARTVGEAQRAEEVIRGLRSLLGNRGLRRAGLDLNDAVNEVLKLVRAELRRSNVDLRTELAPTLPAVFGDRVQLQQVLLNLVLNGIEAMRPVLDRPRELALRTESAAPDGVAVVVEDTGPGIDPATIERIFDPFFTTKANGLGMGLSICRSIVEAHGGRLSASQHAPYGAAFRFTVPVDATAADHREVGTASASGVENILQASGAGARASEA